MQGHPLGERRFSFNRDEQYWDGNGWNYWARTFKNKVGVVYWKTRWLTKNHGSLVCLFERTKKFSSSSDCYGVGSVAGPVLYTAELNAVLKLHSCYYATFLVHGCKLCHERSHIHTFLAWFIQAKWNKNHQESAFVSGHFPPKGSAPISDFSNYTFEHGVFVGLSLSLCVASTL